MQKVWEPRYWAALLLACTYTVQAQTSWTGYMASLMPAISESPVIATLPTDVAIASPPENLTGTLARWSGVWTGWACRSQLCDVKVAVETISNSSATLVYASASATQAPFFERVSAEISGEEIRSRLRTGSTLVLRLRSGGDMEMVLLKPDNQLGAAGVLTKGPLGYTRSVDRVPTPWTENGQTQTLEMVVYQPIGKGQGPFPTLIFNHGSTGNGDRPELFRYTFSAPTVTRYFTDIGWQVLFPQRRGRGKSDGLYDEGFRADRSGYACQTNISLAGLDRAQVDMDVVMDHVVQRKDVDTTRMLIGGVSRGGILSASFAGTRRIGFKGVINFVGGWMGERCSYAESINQTAFHRAAAYGRPMLWLYGDKDPFYSLSHSRKNFDAFVAAGGKGQFLSYMPEAGQSGHFLHGMPTLWQGAMDDYLHQINMQ